MFHIKENILEKIYRKKWEKYLHDNLFKNRVIHTHLCVQICDFYKGCYSCGYMSDFFFLTVLCFGLPQIIKISILKISPLL